MCVTESLIESRGSTYEGELSGDLIEGLLMRVVESSVAGPRVWQYELPRVATIYHLSTVEKIYLLRTDTFLLFIL